MQLTVRPVAIDTFRENTALLSRDCRALRPERDDVRSPELKGETPPIRSGARPSLTKSVAHRQVKTGG